MMAIEVSQIVIPRMVGFLERGLADFHPAFEDWLDAGWGLKGAQAFGEVFFGGFAELGEFGAGKPASAASVGLSAGEFVGDAFWLGFYRIAVQVKEEPSSFAGFFGPSCFGELRSGRRNGARNAKAEENGLDVGFWRGFSGEGFEVVAG